MSLLRILSNITMAAVAVNSPPTLKDCGANGASLFQLDSATLEPVNPVPGEKVALTLKYTVPDMVRIVDGISIYEVSMNFVPLPVTSHTLCQDVACPITPGTHTNTTTSVWPTGVSGRFISKMSWKGVNWMWWAAEGNSNSSRSGLSDEQLLLCLQVSGTLGEETPKRNLRAER